MSIIQNTIEDIRGLKWNGFHSALEEQLSNTSYLKMSFEERLAKFLSNFILTGFFSRGFTLFQSVLICGFIFFLT